MYIYIIEDHQLMGSYLKEIVQEIYPQAHLEYFRSNNEFSAYQSKVSADDVFIMTDLLMPSISVLDLVKQTRNRNPLAKILALTSLTDANMVKLLMKNLVDGYITKDCSEPELIQGIKEVWSGHKFINQSLKERLISQVFDGNEQVYELTPREQEILTLLCEGQMPKEIAIMVGISRNTVHQYIKNIMHKFKVNRTTDLVLVAIQKGFYNPSK
jgi:DNA-binding NarL/FixJ family response regulator